MIGKTFSSSQHTKHLAAWDGRILCIDETEKGYTFLRCHSGYDGETFTLTKEQFEKSFWVEIHAPVVVVPIEERLVKAENVLISLKYLDVNAYDYVREFRPETLPNLKNS